MASSIADVFLRIANQAIKKLEAEMPNHFSLIADHVYDEFDSSQKLNKEFFDDLQARVQVLEAASFFVKQFENAPESRILEIKVKKAKQHDDYLEEIQKDLSRGVVYVTWTRSPEEVLYIGKAGFSGRVKRLADSHHTSLRTSLHSATTLSLLIPTNEDYLEHLEASCIRLMNWPIPSKSLFNKKLETSNIPKGEYSERLDLFADRLNDLASKIRRLQWGKTEKSQTGDLESKAQPLPAAEEPSAPVSKEKTSTAQKKDFLKEYKKADADRKWEIYNIFKEQGWGKPY
jgi:hypothetical protein